MLNALAAAGTTRILNVKKMEVCDGEYVDCKCEYCRKKQEIISFGFNKNIVEEVMKDGLYGG